MERLALYSATSDHNFEDGHSKLPCVFSHSTDCLCQLETDLHLILLEPMAASTLWPGVFGVYQSGFGQGTFLSKKVQPLFLINLYFRIVHSPSVDSTYFCISKHLLICLSISFVTVLSLLHLIEKFIMIMCHINNTDKFITASLDHSSFKTPLKHQVI